MSRFYIFFLLFYILSTNVYSQNKDFIIISELNIEGNKKTKSNIITRELTFTIGDTIHTKNLKEHLSKSKDNIENTLLFNKVLIDTNLLSANYYKIDIIVVERWYLWPYPILEHADRNFSSWLQKGDLSNSNYGVYFQQNNFRGRNEILKFKARFGYKEQAAINYKIPYLNKSQTIGLDFYTSYFRQKEVDYKLDSNQLLYFKSDDYIRNYLNTSLSLSYRLKLYNTFNLNISYYNFKINDSIISLNPDYLFNSNTSSNNITLNLSYKFDKRNSIVYPLYGNYFSAEIDKNISLSNKFSQLFVKANFKKFFKINSYLYFASSANIKYSLINNNSYIFTTGLGYEDNIRGFDYYVISGENFYSLKNNLKFQFFNKEKHLNFIPYKEFNTFHLASYLNIFYDFAYVKNIYSQSSNYMDNSYIYTLGIGIDLVTYYDKVLRIEYSYNNFKIKGLYINFTAPI